MNNLMNYFITPAYADTTAPGAGGGSPVSLFVMFAVFFLFFYFVMWRPQSKRAKEHRELITALAKGDEILTSGGLLGKIHKINEKYVTLLIHNNTEIIVQKAAIVGALPKGTLKSLE